jgi:hypothetical protein
MPKLHIEKTGEMLNVSTEFTGISTDYAYLECLKELV